MPTAPKMPLRLMTLGGPPELVGPDGEPYKLPNTKHLALLAYLTLEPGDYLRTALTKFVWSSGEAGSMNDALSSLRTVFGEEAFPRRAQRIAFDPSLVTCDAVEFRALAADTNNPEARHNALTLYRGPFFQDFNTRGASTRYIRWVEEKRAEFERLFLALSEAECAQVAADERWADLAAAAQEAERKAPGWDRARHWSDLARQRLLPPEAPVVTASATGADDVGRTHHETFATAQSPLGKKKVAVAPALVLLLVVIAGTWVWSQIRHTPPAGEQPSPGSDRSVTNAPLCEPGKGVAQLVDEVFHFGIQARPGLAFVKAWTLQNSGSCSWSREFRLHYKSSSSVRLSTTIMDVPLERPIGPGDTVTFRLQMRAPTAPGTYDEHWELRDRGDKPVLVNGKPLVAARIVVPKPNPPACEVGQSTATQLVKKFMDGVVRRPGEQFRFGWTLKNTGTCSWPAGATFRFRSASNGRVSRESVVQPTRSVAPGQNYTFLVSVETPHAAGVYREEWEFNDAGGETIPTDGEPTVAIQFRVPDPHEPVATIAICRPGEEKVRFVDENWLDETVMRPGQQFVKRWTVFNVGSCAWGANFSLRYTSNTNGILSLSQNPRPLGEIVPPWTTYTFEIPMRMPRQPGAYREDWRFTDAAGNLIRVSLSPYVAAILNVGEP